MNIYIKKQRWKLLLFAFAVLIGITSLWFTNVLANKLANEERKKVELWAEAIKKKASLVKYTEQLFSKLESDERKKVELWAEAMDRLLKEDNSTNLTFYLKIISNNKTIPIILANTEDIVTSSVNLDFELKSNEKLSEKIKRDFSKYAPIKVEHKNKTLNYIYHKDSKLFTELQDVLNDLIESFISEVVINSASSPVIITDSTKTQVIAFGNIDSLIIQDSLFLQSKITDMSASNPPIEIELGDNSVDYIFYEDSYLLKQLQYYPFVQFGIIALFIFIAYFAFSTSRKAEQNQVWVGMSKETAHQLGTPTSSLLAWIEILKQTTDPELIDEINKDVKRLETITERFSKIGSAPTLSKVNIIDVLIHAVNYIKTRTSDKIEFQLDFSEEDEILVPINTPLFEWVIENLCKNAIDAMEGVGKIKITVSNHVQMVYIDITDTGKGVSKSKYKTIFHPGYTTKRRGWGLGLSLSKRIIESYHAGKIFIKKSELDIGTTIRTVLKI